MNYLTTPTQVIWHLTWSELCCFFQTIYTAIGGTSRLEQVIFGGHDPVIAQTLQRVWQQSIEGCLTDAAHSTPSWAVNGSSGPPMGVTAPPASLRQPRFRCRGRSRIYYQRSSKPTTPAASVSVAAPLKVAPLADLAPPVGFEQPSNAVPTFQVPRLTSRTAGALLITVDFCVWLQVEMVASVPPTSAALAHLEDTERPNGPEHILWQTTLILAPQMIRDRLNLAVLATPISHLLSAAHDWAKQSSPLQHFWHHLQSLNPLTRPLTRPIASAMPSILPPTTPSPLSKDLAVALIEHLPIGMFQVGLEGGFLKANPAFCRLMGYTETQLLRLDLEAITPPAEFGNNVELIQQIVQYGEQRIFETRFRTATNALIWAEVHLLLVGKPEAEGSYLLGFVTDVSDRHRLEAERRQAAQDIQKRQERETVLNNLVQRIRSTLDLTTMLQSAAEELRQALGADRVVVYRIFPDASGCCIAESVNIGYPKMMGQTFDAECIPPPYLGAYSAGRLWSVDNVDTAALTCCHQEMLCQVEVKSMVATGILSMEDALAPEKRNLWGLLTIHQCGSVRQWTPEELQLVQAVANQLAIALEQTKLLNQLSGYAAELEERVNQRTYSLQKKLKFEQFTRNLVECLNHDLEENHLLQMAANGLLSTLEADMCLIGLIDRSRQQFAIYIEAIGPSAPSAESLLGQSFWLATLTAAEQDQLAQGKTFQYTGDLAGTAIIKRAFEDPAAAIATPAQTAVRKMISPILEATQLVGLLIVVQFASREFEPDEIELVKETTNYCAIALRQTKLYHQEHEQRLSAEYLRSFLEKSIDIFVEYDTQLRYISVNPAGCALLQLPQEEIIGKTNRELIGPIADVTEQLIQQAIQSREKVFVDHELRLANGPRVFETIYAPITAPTGAVQRVIAVSRDVTELKDQWQLLELQNQQLAETNRLKQEFIATTSHELRTPLTAILGFSNVLLQEFFGELNTKQQAYLERIHGSGQHLLELINDILDLSRLEAGRMELDLQTIYIVDVCEGVINLVQERAIAQGLTLQLDIDPDVEWITADPRRLKQILLNLLSNAVKFTPQGTVGLRVYRQSRSLEYTGYFADTSQQAIAALHDVIHFQVWDTGIGINEADQHLLFAPFSQIDNSLSRQHQGTGLGLTITRKLTELHGGWVSLESRPGNGATFTISIPVRLS